MEEIQDNDKIIINTLVKNYNESLVRGDNKKNNLTITILYTLGKYIKYLKSQIEAGLPYEEKLHSLEQIFDDYISSCDNICVSLSSFTSNNEVNFLGISSVIGVGENF